MLLAAWGRASLSLHEDQGIVAVIGPNGAARPPPSTRSQAYTTHLRQMFLTDAKGAQENITAGARPASPPWRARTYQNIRLFKT
jgi:ABC-type branched-subunit amino acid transport system ATPase component